MEEEKKPHGTFRFGNRIIEVEPLNTEIEFKASNKEAYDAEVLHGYIADEAGQWPMREQQPLTFVQAMQENGKTLKLIQLYCMEAGCTPEDLINTHRKHRFESLMCEMQPIMDRWTYAQIMINQLSRPPFSEESIRRQEKYRSEARVAEDELAELAEYLTKEIETNA